MPCRSSDLNRTDYVNSLKSLHSPSHSLREVDSRAKLDSSVFPDPTLLDGRINLECHPCLGLPTDHLNGSRSVIPISLLQTVQKRYAPLIC